MQRFRSRLIAVALATALAAPFFGVEAAQAAGTPSPNGCKASTQPGAQIGMYPANPSSMSSLRYSCTFNNQPAGPPQVAAAFTINDFDVAQYHNGAARTITNTAVIPVNATSFTAPNCTGLVGPAVTRWVNRGIATVGGVLGMPARTFVKSFTTTVAPACTVTLSNPTGTSAIAASTSFKIDNANARSVANSVTNGTVITFGAGATVITSTQANFQNLPLEATNTDTGLSISGTEFADGTTITGCGATAVPPVAANQCNISLPTLAADSGVAVPSTTVTIGGTILSTSTRQCNDATNTATVITSVACKFKASDVGLPVKATALGAGPFYITSVAGNTATVAAGGMTANAVAFNLVVGDPSATAPNGTDQAAMQGVQLDLSPGLVAGSGSCAAENAEGFATVARWNNPGSFAGSVLFNTQPAATKAIGQIYFDTSVADFSGFVIERVNPAVAGRFLYDIVFPNAPTTTAMCPGTATSPGLGFSLTVQASTLGQASLASGVGRPGTAQLRGVLPAVGGPGTGYTSASTITSQTVGVTFLPLTEFTRTLFYPAGPVATTFIGGG